MRKSLFKINLFRVIGLILLGILLCAAFYKFNSSIKDVIKDTSIQSLKETSEFYARTFELKINDQLSMLESQSRYFSEVDMNDYFLLKKTITSTKGIGEFKRISVANDSGMILNYQGTTSRNIFTADFFQEAMKSGKPQISGDVIVDEDGEYVLILAVPIIQKDQPVGVICGSFSYSILNSLFSVASFNGLGHSALVSSDGKVIVSSYPDLNKIEIVDIFNDLEDRDNTKNDLVNSIYSNMKNNKDGFFSIDSSKKDRFCYYTPVGVNDWYIFSYVQSDYIKKMQHSISIAVYSLIAIILLVFIVIFVLFVQLQNKATAVLNDVERYAIANEQNQSCVFEYDLRTHKIKFSGSYEFVLGKIHNPIDLNSLRNLYVSIHEDDKNVMEHMNDFFAEKQDNFVAELRFKCTDGEYRWFRLSGTSVKNENNQIDKFVGNFTNVNAQVLHEQELRYIAETDMLSGLLNKNFFQKKVSRALDCSDSNISGALFIIDLDNFKTTNDTLGHSMGDIVIRDTAQKISLIFSKHDTIGRIGGDEFCVFMRLDSVNQNVAAKIIMEKAATLNETLQEYYNNDISSVRVSASVGIALWPQQAESFNQLFRCADAALYYVKQHGKDSNVIFTEKMKNGDESFYE
ncbi:MAG: diguanylate cyclase [Treponema sp.]|nr:diguanylate cyclase [Treponema sp.]